MRSSAHGSFKYKNFPAAISTGTTSGSPKSKPLLTSAAAVSSTLERVILLVAMGSVLVYTYTSLNPNFTFLFKDNYRLMLWL